MAVNRQEVLHMAKLARLRLSDDEVETYRTQLSDILEYVEKLNELDTAHIEPTTHAVPLEMNLREDVVERRLDLQTVMSNAPDAADGQFRVPKVVED